MRRARPASSGFVAVRAYLEGLRAFEVRPGLERMEKLCELTGHPERSAPSVHVTGTNGKGSTSRLIAAILEERGLLTGLYTSPHLERIEERISIGGEPVAPGTFVDLVLDLVPTFEELRRSAGEGPTHFDALTTVGLVAMQRRHVDAMVVEVGLGGRSDSTNVVDAKVAVVTNVALDHVELLGATTELIAREKAGIIKAGSCAVVGESDPALASILVDRCAEVGAHPLLAGRDFHITGIYGPSQSRSITLRTPRRTYREVRVPYEGLHQARNAACAIVAAEAFLDGALSDELIERAWRDVPNPGRFEVIGSGPTVVIDVAHNPHGVAALAETLGDRFGDGPRITIFGVNPHKDVEAMLDLLRPGSHAILTTEAPDAPAVPAVSLAKVAAGSGWKDVEAVPDPIDAVERALELARREDVIVCTGSHYWIGIVRRRLLELA